MMETSVKVKLGTHELDSFVCAPHDNINVHHTDLQQQNTKLYFDSVGLPRYSCLDLSFMHMARRVGRCTLPMFSYHAFHREPPVFVPCSINFSYEMACHSYISHRVDLEIPAPVRLRMSFKKLDNCDYVSRLAVPIPDDIIMQAQHLLGTTFAHVGVIQEADSWTETRPQGDPILVGFVLGDSINSRAHLLAHWDMSTIESYVVSEFMA